MQFFVTATDTGVGKTQVAAALLGLMSDAGLDPFAFKPYESGIAELGAPPDALRLQHAGGHRQSLSSISLYRFKTALAPGIAARAERKRTSFAKVVKAHRTFGKGSGVIEGAGGLFVPLDDQHDVIDLIAALKVKVILVARAGLGTINHTRLSVEALERRRIAIAAVVLNCATSHRDESMHTNREALQRRLPRISVLGPVRFIKAQPKRDAALRDVLEPLLSCSFLARSDTD